MKQNFKRDPHRRLIHTLRDLAADEARLQQSSSRPWASATFVGATHRLTFRVSGERAMDRAQALGEAMAGHEYCIPDHIVADMVVDGYAPVSLPDGQAAVDVRLAALTVEDW